MVDLVFDLLVAAGLVGTAAAALRVRDLQAGIVLFIVFALLMALAWVRLEAPDVALAEAAIGGGITGALLLEALSRIGPEERSQLRGAAEASRPHRRTPAVAAIFAAAAVAALIGAATIALPADEPGLRPAVDGAIEAGGVENPVTAVLLNFRAYDTWLEIAVLLAAVAGILALLRAHEPRVRPARAATELLDAFTRAAVPVMVLVGLYLLWRGTSGPGGAFQAGAVLGAAGGLLFATGVARGVAALAWRWRAILIAGVGAFALLGIGSMLAGSPLLTYPREGAGTLILAIEAAVTLAIAGTLSAVLAAVLAAAGSGDR